MDPYDPNLDLINYPNYQPPQAQYYYPDSDTSQQQTYAPIYVGPQSHTPHSYTPPLLSPQQLHSPTGEHAPPTFTQAQYEAAQAQAQQQYAAATSQPPSQYAISDAPSNSSASEDPDVKRQRNTAASARFRAKKKQREQELQASERAKREALQRLECKVKDLEDENRFLKDLILTPKQKRENEKAKEKEAREEEDGNSTEGPGEMRGRNGRMALEHRGH